MTIAVHVKANGDLQDDAQTLWDLFDDEFPRRGNSPAPAKGGE